MARPAGLEPATPGLEGRCSIQLSYGRVHVCYVTFRTHARVREVADGSAIDRSPMPRKQIVTGSSPAGCRRQWHHEPPLTYSLRVMRALRRISWRGLSAALFMACGLMALAVVVRAQAPGGAPQGQATNASYRPPRTPWGDPDLEGKWPGTHLIMVPLQRPESFGTRNVLTDEEFAKLDSQADRQRDQDTADFDFDNPSIPFGQIGGGQSPPPHWLERGEPQRQASLIVDPPNGRLPALTAAAQKRDTDRRAAAPGPGDSYTDFTLYERCISRGLPGSILPTGYNSGNQIVQAPGYVIIMNEMIHESRIVPLDGRPHVGAAIRSYLGDSRGRWDGDTLVVETTNFIDRPGVGLNGSGAGDAMTITERFTRTSPTALRHSLTVDDPMTWTRPITMQYDLARDDRYGMFEYACHEGNHALPHIMSGARATERATGKPPAPLR